MSKYLSLDVMTVLFKDSTTLQITANDIKHHCLNSEHTVKAIYDIASNYNLCHFYTFKDEDVEEIIQSWHKRTAKEVK